MKERWVLLACIFVLSCFGLLSHVSGADEVLTDDQKKRIVYDMYENYRKDFPKAREISPRKAMAALAAGRIQFVDTRKPAEMEVSMLPGAISTEEFLKDPKRYAEKQVVAYCTISYRSGKFAQEMAKKGIEILNLRGGLLAWVLEGGKVYDARGETRRINVYGKEWDYPPKDMSLCGWAFFKNIFESR